jgi:hypothetical protein
VKKIAKKPSKNLPSREQVMHSMMASFKIEGIDIPLDMAIKVLKKVELNLGK